MLSGSRQARGLEIKRPAGKSFPEEETESITLNTMVVPARKVHQTPYSNAMQGASLITGTFGDSAMGVFFAVGWTLPMLIRSLSPALLRSSACGRWPGG